MEQIAKIGTSILSYKLSQVGLKFVVNPKIAMKLQIKKSEKEVFVGLDLFLEKGTVIAFSEITEGQ